MAIVFSFNIPSVLLTTNPEKPRLNIDGLRLEISGCHFALPFFISISLEADPKDSIGNRQSSINAIGDLLKPCATDNMLSDKSRQAPLH
jgi:hypothetical protein